MSAAKFFHDMADRIEKMDAKDFAGAAVVVPPGGGDPITLLLVSPKPDLVLLWSSVKSLVEIKQADVMEEARNRQAGGWR